MTSQYTLSGTKRENFGKRASKRYRVDNMVPAVIYGASKENQSILINSFELAANIAQSSPTERSMPFDFK